MELDAAASIRDADELRRTVPVLIGTILAFFVHQPSAVEPATVALTGAASGCSSRRIPLEQALAKIEWPTLFFFVALFVMVGALEETGAIGHVADARQEHHRRRPHRRAARDPLDRGDRARRVVDNIPFTTAMIPVVKELQRRAAATTPTGGRSRSAPASAATPRSSPPPPTSPRPG